jgi:hypothetical protein
MGQRKQRLGKETEQEHAHCNVEKKDHPQVDQEE